MALSDDVAQFFSTDDFAVNATFGAETKPVILDAPGESLLGDRIASSDYAITYPTTSFAGLKHGDAITVDGVGYKVRSVNSLDDGKLMRAWLSRNA